jgi:hypothetical protein
MEFLSSHWHCIVPAAAILLAMFLMRDKSENKGKDQRTAAPKEEIKDL